MINKHIFFPIFVATVAAAMPLQASAKVTREEAKVILGDTIPYGEQKLEVALGYTEQRDQYTGAQSSVKAETIEKWHGTSLKEAIRGKLSGWYNGKIRGESSPSEGTTNSNTKYYSYNALVVLDGIPLPFFSLDNLDPTTVEDVTILKDAAAKALYGPAGAQGVILITTKHGKNNTMKVNVSAEAGIKFATKKAKMLGAYDQAVLRNQALINDGLQPQFSDEQLAAFNDGTGVNNDWREMYLKDRFYQKYNVQVGAGSEKVRFYINTGFSRENGDYKTDWKEKYDASSFTNRFTLVSNLDVDVFPWMRAFANTNVNIQRINAAHEGLGEVNKTAYITPAWVPDGMTDDGRIITKANFANPIYGLINYSGLNRRVDTDLNANIGLDIDMAWLTKGLTFKGVFGYSSTYVGVRGGTHDYERAIWNADTQKYETYGTNVATPLAWAKGTNFNYYMDIQAMFNYERSFGDNYIHANLNYMAEDYRGDWYKAGWILPTSRIQLGGELKYGFKNRYFIQFDFTHAGSEMMNEGHRFHFSPTYSAAWVASNESWLKNDILTYLKFRGSYGQLQYDTLRDAATRYLYSTEYREGAGYIKGLFSGFGISEGLIGNPNIGWEKSYQQDFGVDLGFLDKFHLTFDYWRVDQKNMLLQSSVNPTVGGIMTTRRPYTNSGELVNKGFDFSLDYATVLPCGLEIVASAQIGFNKNKWIDADELSFESANYAYAYRKTGYEAGQEWGFLVDNSNGSIFYNSQAEIDGSGLIYSGAQPRPGDLKYKDLNGDGHIDEADYAPLAGTRNTPRIEYGANVQLAYKGFDLYLDFIGQGGQSRLFNNAPGVAEYCTTTNATTGAKVAVTPEGMYMPHHQNAWTAERAAAGLPIDYPRLTSSNSSSLQANSFFTSKCDFFRLRNITLGYSLPDNVVRKLGMSKLRFFVSGQNLLTWDNMKFDGIDPEQDNVYTFTYRSVNFGLNINF